jgi:rRNA maturation protein Rpf1
MNRGKSSLITLAEKTLEHRAEKVVIVDRWKGGVGKLQLFEIGESGLTRRYPTMYVKSTKLQRDFPHTRRRSAVTLALQAAPNIPLPAKKLADALSHFLDIPNISPENTFHESGRQIHLSANDAHRIQITFLEPQETEIGPRITISHLVWAHQQ